MSECILTPAVTPAVRQLSTAEARREDVLRAAERVFAERGMHATPITAVAKEAGISQAYVFRLFPTKTDLVVATARRCNERIKRTFAEAAARAKVEGADPLEAMGTAYTELLADRTLLLLQLHGQAASASMPEVRDAMREGFGEIVELVRRESGASAVDLQRFMAFGMLLNVLTAMDATELDVPWVTDLLAGDADC